MCKEHFFNHFFMTCAVAASKLSTARRAQVGAILVRDGRIIATGYNGQPYNVDNCCEIENADGTLTTKSTVVHAELNVILFCAKHGISTNDTSLYITLSPCEACVTSIIQAGIKKIYYLEHYRNTAGIAFLQKAGIKVEHFTLTDV